MFRSGAGYGFNVDRYMGDSVLPNLTPAVTALSEQWRKHADKPRLIKPLRWLATYLTTHSTLKKHSSAPSKLGGCTQRAVLQEESRTHATSLLKAAWENKPQHVAFWMKIGGECAVLSGKETRCNFNGWTALHYAVLHNNVELSTVILHAGGDPNAACDYGLTPVMIASYHGYLDMLRVLLDFSVELDSFSYNDASPMEPQCGAEPAEVELLFGHTALHWALQQCEFECDDCAARMANKMEVAKVLIEHGADADALSAKGDSPWHLVALHEELVDVAEDLAIYGKMMHSQEFPAGDLLCLAARRGNGKLITFLRGKGFDVDALDKEDCTALFCAAATGHSDVVQLLGDKGANLSATCTAVAQTPLHTAAQNNHLKCVKALAALEADLEAEDSRGHRPLHTASKHGHQVVVQLLLSLGVQVDPVDSAGTTPYSLASEAGHREVAEELSQAGAASDNKDVHGQQAIHLASQSGQLTLVDLALDKSAPVDVLDNKRRTPLLMAAASGHLNVVEHLALYGASVNVVDVNSQTPLHHAACSNRVSVVHWLCENGAKLDAGDLWARTPLYLAAKHDNVEIVKRLLDVGAQPDVMTEEKLQVDVPKAPSSGAEAETAGSAGEKGEEEEEEEDVVEVAEEITSRAAIHVACVGLHVEVVQMLAACGADVDAEADDGLTPLQTAVKCGVKRADAEQRIIMITDVLVNYGATLNLTDFDGRTAYQNATIQGMRSVRARLKEIGVTNEMIDSAMTVKR
eukprot:TRINITY_DN7307_c0_g1_i3.p1 TRINITY_DN7307_c0_g1~~TRINITY_DN7307_c0_g1_i3.p1  ORF type:complete len:747 (+),score=219.82 TRINITY_DN7307_c0_g1_i3:1665-3905(+)